MYRFFSLEQGDGAAIKAWKREHNQKKKNKKEMGWSWKDTGVSEWMRGTTPKKVTKNSFVLLRLSWILLQSMNYEEGAACGKELCGGLVWH